MTTSINAYDTTYLELLKRVLENGKKTGDRTGVGTLKLFGEQMKFNLSTGFFPLLTTKKVAWNSLVTELLWFISGSTNIRPLVLADCNIWNEWPFVSWLKKTSQQVPVQGSAEWKTLLRDFIDRIKEDVAFAETYGDLGPVYGKQWTSWSAGKESLPINQLAEVIHSIKTNPASRRHIVSAWNPAELDQMALPPCHYSFQFDVTDDRLSLLVNQRSADMFLGVPFNIASYALLLLMMAQVTNLKPAELTWNGGDTHLYLNHLTAATEQLTREPKPAPRVVLNPDITDLFTFTSRDITLEDYDPHPPIKAPVAV